MDIPRLTRNQIAEYNSFDAFAVSRSEAAATAGGNRSRPFITSSAQQSLGLLKNLTKNLETLRGNLQLMHNFAQQGMKAARLTDERRDEIFGQLRSLAAGIDIIVRDFQLDGRPLLDGRRFELSTGVSKLRMSLDNLSTVGEDSLGLTRRREGAWADVSYDMMSIMRNTTSGLTGLDISHARAISPAQGKAELDDGEYRVKVSYAGADSIVELQRMDGTVIQKKEGVDLSGTGKELVDMGLGVQLAFEKTLFRTPLGGDKYDHELLGPTTLYAVLKYERNYEQELIGDERAIPQRQSTVEIARGGTIKGSTGKLNVGASIAGVGEGVMPMKTGLYDLKVKYDGERSSLWLYDPRGTLVSIKRGIDLTKEGKQSIDTGVGIKIELNGEDFTSNKRDYSVYLNYVAQDKPSETFDYRAFSKRLEQSLKTIDDQIATVQMAQDEIIARHQIVQQAQQIGNAASAATLAQSVSSLIASAMDGASPIDTFADAQNQFLFTAQSLFNTIGGSLQAQGDISPTVLSTF